MSFEPESQTFATELDQARQGDEIALARVLGRVEGQLRSHLRDRLGRRLRLQLGHSDVLQNTYVTVVRLLPRFEGQTERRFFGWIRQILEHEIRRLDRWFRAKRRAGSARGSSPRRPSRIVLPDLRTPSKEAIAAEVESLFWRSMKALSPDHRRILELAILEKRSHEEMAAHMNRSVEATRMLLSRARAALSLELRELERPPPPHGHSPSGV